MAALCLLPAAEGEGMAEDPVIVRVGKVEYPLSLAKYSLSSAEELAAMGFTGANITGNREETIDSVIGNLVHMGIVENKLMEEVNYLTSMLYSQLGMTKEVFEGTANDQVMLNYYNRTIEPIVSAISEEFNRKFLTKTARAKKQRIMYFNSLFRLGTLTTIAAAGAQLVGSEINTRNEIRQALGFKPADGEFADQLMNPNINPQSGMAEGDMGAGYEEGYAEDPYAEEPVTIGETRVADLL